MALPPPSAMSLAGKPEGEMTLLEKKRALFRERMARRNGPSRTLTLALTLSRTRTLALALTLTLALPGPNPGPNPNPNLNPNPNDGQAQWAERGGRGGATSRTGDP
jgi:hypothetical protein